MPPQTLEILKRYDDGRIRTHRGDKIMGPDQDPVEGPQVAFFNPSPDGREYKFKTGVQNVKNDTLCKKRYQLISVTALGNLPTTSSRNLRGKFKSPPYFMQLTIGSSDFDSATKVLATLASLAVLALAIIIA